MSQTANLEMIKGMKLIIPQNQRGYSWDIKNIQELMSDVELATKREKMHYLGPLIITKDQGESSIIADNHESIDTYTLEDGQQRITSIIFLLKSLHDRFDNLNSPEALELEKLIFIIKDGERMLRLENKNPSLDACFRHCITNSPYPSGETPPMKAMKKASEWAKSKFENMPEEECLIWKNSFIRSIKFSVVDLLTEKFDRFLTFDAINSRGLPLSQFDKIKNFCILINDVRRLDINPEENWYSALQELEKYGAGTRSYEETFIREMFNVFHDVKEKKENIYSEFAKIYGKLISVDDVELKIELTKFVNLWGKYAKSFGLIAYTEKDNYEGSEYSREARDWLIRIDHMDKQAITRTILSIAFYKFNQEDFKEIARICEIFSFRVI